MEDAELTTENQGLDNENPTKTPDFSAEIFSQFEARNSESTTEIKNEDQNISPEGEIIDGIPISDLLALLPPDIASDLVSPELYLAYKLKSKDLDEETAKQIKPLYETPEQFRELKKSLWKKVIQKYFPNYKGEVSPVMALCVISLFQLTNSNREASQFLAEKEFLTGGKNVEEKNKNS